MVSIRQQIAAAYYSMVEKARESILENMKRVRNSQQAGWSMPITWIILFLVLGVALFFGWKVLLYAAGVVVLITIAVYIHDRRKRSHSEEKAYEKGQAEGDTAFVSPRSNSSTREMGDIPVSDGYALRVHFRDTENFSAAVIYCCQIEGATLEEQIGTAVGRLVPAGAESNAHWRVNLFVTTKRMEAAQVEGKWTRVVKDVRSIPPRLSNEIAVTLVKEGLVAEPYIVWTADYTPLGEVSAGTILDDD